MQYSWIKFVSEEPRIITVVTKKQTQQMNNSDSNDTKYRVKDSLV